MANTHLHFLKFEQAISLTPGKKTKLIASRQALQQKIVAYFKTQSGISVPKFYIQGSYKMKTMVVGKDGTYDVDLGVYFLEQPKLTPLTYQQHVVRAVGTHTAGGAEHREKCIRVRYQGDFDIDLPVYYKTQADRHPWLATKTQWQESDPKELCDWFEKQRKQKDKNGQLLRLVKYFKAWANERTKKMPSGIAFTVWVVNNYISDERDDVAFFKTAKNIKADLSWTIKSKNPATPGDDFLARLDSTQKNNFGDAFKQLIADADAAIAHADLTKSVNLWRKQLGNKF